MIFKKLKLSNELLSISLVVFLVLLSLSPIIFIFQNEAYALSWPLPTYETAFSDFKKFNLLTQDDIDVFKWIKSNTHISEVILVSQTDTGQYLASITGRKVVNPFGPLEGSRNYRLLCFAIESDPANPYILSLLHSFDISYVFVGSKAYDPTAPTWTAVVAQNAVFNAEILLNSPFFSVAKKVGNAYLFKVNYYDKPKLIGPQISIFRDNTLLGSSALSGVWFTKLGFDSGVNAYNARLFSFDSAFSTVFKFDRAADLSTFTYISLAAKSSIPLGCHLLIYDISDDFVSLPIALTNQPVVFVFDLASITNEVSRFSLKEVSRIEFISDTGLSNSLKTLELGSVLLSKSFLTEDLSEEIEVDSRVSQFSLLTQGLKGSVIAVPSFLNYSNNSSQFVMPLGFSDFLFIKGLDSDINLSFTFAFSDPRTNILAHFERPLREPLLYSGISNSSLPIISSNNFGGQTYNLDMKSWAYYILEFNNVNVMNGTSFLSVSSDSSNFGQSGPVVSLFRSLADADSRQNCITQFSLSNLGQYTTFETGLQEINYLYFRIDSCDFSGSLTLGVRFFSFGLYI